MIDEKKLIEELQKGQAVIQDMLGDVGVSAIYETINCVIDEIYRQPQADKWIPCEERLPSEEGQYLVTIVGFIHTVVDTAYFDSERWHMISKVLAWQPLPQPYKKEGAE